MIPERIHPRQARNGLVVIAFDLDGNEVTRSIATPERMGEVEWLASDAGEAVVERGGGCMVVYDGDDGALLWRGPMRRVGEAATHHITDLQGLVESYLAAHGERFHWQVVGVFPVETDDPEDPPNAWWNAFLYTVLLGPYELWVPCCSIEGRCAGFDMMAEFLNWIACGVQMGAVSPGDSVIVPMGVHDADDVDTVWWLGELTGHKTRYQTFQSIFGGVIPIRWSSGLGWKE